MKTSPKILTAFVLLNFLTTQVFSQSLNDDLLIYYPFDGNAQDQSGNGFDGNVNATLTEDQFGNIASAYSFNGASEFIDLPNDPALKPQLPLSYSAWVKFYSLPSTGNVIFTNNFAQDNHSGAWMQVASGGQLAICYGSALGGTNGNNIRIKRGTTILQTDKWYHIAGVIRGETDMDLYINCVDDGGYYNGTSNSPIDYTTDAGSIGRKDNAGIPPYYFHGELDEFRYWSRAITLSDIDRICVRNASINENSIQQNNIVVYPNPTESIISFSGDTNLINEYNITDLNGRVILTSSQLSNVDVSNISNGVYYIHFSLNDGSFTTEKLLIK